VPAALLIGAVGGVSCYFAVTKLKARFLYDDALDVFGVHCVGSIVGMLLCGYLASTEVNPALASTFQRGGKTIALAGGSVQLINQAIGIAFTAVFAGLSSWLILKLLDATIGLRIDQEGEDIGLDLSEHGEKAYND
jgi:Amt family ammonium transporter